MKRQLIQDALTEIKDKHILEAATYKKPRVLPWIGTVAAVLALVIGLQFLQVPLAMKAEAVVLADEPRVESQPQREDYVSDAQWQAENDLWQEQQKLRKLMNQKTTDQMEPFLYKSLRVFLRNQDENLLCSPANAYLGLAMAAELTGGDTQQQLLKALGTENLEELRLQASALWENVFAGGSTQSVVHTNRGTGVVRVTNLHEVSTLANSLWLDDSLDYDRRAMAPLARHYYASVYRQDLSDPQAAKNIGAWIDQNTGNLLTEASGSIELPDDARIALYSTIYFQSRWADEFDASKNTDAIFHGASADAVTTFMNKNSYQTYYYFGNNFGAVALELKNGSTMWFLLPKEDKTVADILDDPQYLELLTGSSYEYTSKKYMLVNLSVPKFDVQAKKDLKEGLMGLGITDLFRYGSADFSASLEEPAFISSANQAVRVKIDETGVTAAAYIELPAAGAAAPPDEIIDFILDRPFLFLITDSTGIPLFAGSVQNP